MLLSFVLYSLMCAPHTVVLLVHTLFQNLSYYALTCGGQFIFRIMCIRICTISLTTFKFTKFVYIPCPSVVEYIDSWYGSSDDSGTLFSSDADALMLPIYSMAMGRRNTNTRVPCLVSTQQIQKKPLFYPLGESWEPQAHTYIGFDVHRHQCVTTTIAWKKQNNKSYGLFDI